MAQQLKQCSMAAGGADYFRSCKLITQLKKITKIYFQFLEFIASFYYIPFVNASIAYYPFLWQLARSTIFETQINFELLQIDTENSVTGFYRNALTRMFAKENDEILQNYSIYLGNFFIWCMKQTV